MFSFLYLKVLIYNLAFFFPSRNERLHKLAICFLYLVCFEKLFLPISVQFSLVTQSCPTIFPSIRVFSNESVLRIRWPKYWSFSFNINPSNEHSGQISFRMDCLGLLAVQGTLKSFLQHYSSKVSILWQSTFFIVQLSHPYMTTGKTIALKGCC